MDRQLALILKLRADLKQLRTAREELKKFNSAIKGMAKIAPDSGLSSLKKDLEEIKQRLNQMSGSFEGVRHSSSRATQEISKVKDVEKPISKTVEAARRLKGAFGKIFGSAPDDVRKLTGSMGRASNEMIEMANRAIQVNRHTTVLGENIRNLHSQFFGLSSTINQTRNVLGNLADAGPQAAAAISQLNVSLNALKATEHDVIAVTDTLTNKLREIQIVGGLRGTSRFEEERKGIQLYRREIELVRLDIAQLTNETLKLSKTTGVSKGMIEDFQKIKIQVENVKGKIKELSETIVEMGRKSREFDKLKQKGESIKNTIGLLAKEYEKSSIKGAEGAQKLGIEYSKLLEKARALMVVLGGQTFTFQSGAFKATNFEKFLEIFKRLGTEGAGEMKALSVEVEKLEANYTESMNRMIASSEQYLSRTVKDFEGAGKSLANQEVLLKKLVAAHEPLVQQFNMIQAGLEKYGNSFRNSGLAIQMSERLLKKLNEQIRLLPPELRMLVSSMRDWITANFQAETSVEVLQGRIKNLGNDVARLIGEDRALVAASGQLGNSQTLLARRVDTARKISALYTDTIIHLNQALIRLKTSGQGASEVAKFIQQQLDILGQEAIQAAEAVKILEDTLNRLQRIGGDAARAMDRITARGFANMIVSQAAWMAGFQVIFGTLDRFKKALGSIAELQAGVARGMRSARSVALTSAQAIEAFTKSMTEARARTGRSFEDLGEIIYQLGSANLSVEESVAALDSTLANIIGTEADVGNITKLVAGLYLNFRDQIVKVNGEVKSTTEAMREHSDEIEESITLTEKFVYLNDVLVKAFNDNQVEMGELRDGLKFMAQSGRAANLAFDEMVGILSFLNNHLIKAGAAGRAMRVILSKLTQDARGFEEAFDIEIDMSKPLDFLEVMEKVNKSVGGGVISIDKLGTIFQKLGLRGAESFNLIQRNIGEVRETIDIIRRGAKGAASEMEQIRLGDFASQATIAGAKVEAFLMRGLTPLLDAAKTAIKLFNKLSIMIGRFDESMGGLLSTLVGVAGKIGVILLLGAAFSKLGLAIGFLGRLAFHLVARFSEIGKSSDEIAAKTSILASAFSRATVKVKALGTALATTGKQAWAAQSQMAGFSKVTTFASTSISGVSKALSVLGGAAKGIGIIALIMAFQWLIDQLDKTHEKLIENTKASRDASDAIHAYVNRLQLLQIVLDKYGDSTKEGKMALKELSIEVGISSKNFENMDDAISEVSEKTSILIEKQKALASTLKDTYIENEIKQISAEVSNLHYWSDATASAFDKIVIAVKKITVEMSKAMILTGLFLQDIAKIFYKKLTGRSLEPIEVQIKINREEVLENNKIISELEEKLKRLRALSEKTTNIRIKEDIEKTIKTTEKYLESSRKARDAAVEEVRILEQTSVERAKGIDRTRTQTEENDKLKEAMHAVAKGQKEYNSHLIKMNAAAVGVRSVVAAMEDLESSSRIAIGEIKEQFEEIYRQEYLAQFSFDLSNIIDKLGKVGEKTEDFKKLMSEATKLGTEGKKYVLSLAEQIQDLQEKLVSLSSVSISLDIESLAKQIDHLGTGVQRNLSILENLISTTGKYASEVEKVVDDIQKNVAEVYKLEGAQFALNASSKEYIEIDRQIDSMNKKKLILEERLTRQEEKMYEQVKKGLRSYEEMRDRTEKYIREEEDLMMVLVDLEAAYQKLDDAGEDSTKAYEEYAAVQRALNDATEKRIRIMEEEQENTRRLRNEYDRIGLKIKDQISLIKQQDSLRESEIQKQQDLASSFDESTASMYKKKQAYETIKGLVERRMQLLDDEYKKELELIDLDRKSGRLTAAQEALNKQIAGLVYDERRLKLQEEYEKAIGDEKQIITEVEEKHHEAILKISEAMQGMKEALGEVEITYDRVKEKIKENITIGINFDEEGLEEASEYLQSWLYGQDYKIRVEVESVKMEGEKLGGIIRKTGGIIERAKGGAIPAKVTSGEGYVPPAIAQQNLPILNAINRGEAPIKQIHGKGGVDNITTQLPVHSYIVSKRGMQKLKAIEQEIIPKYKKGKKFVREEIVRKITEGQIINKTREEVETSSKEIKDLKTLEQYTISKFQKGGRVTDNKTINRLSSIKQYTISKFHDSGRAFENNRIDKAIKEIKVSESKIKKLETIKNNNVVTKYQSGGFVKPKDIEQRIFSKYQSGGIVEEKTIREVEKEIEVAKKEMNSRAEGIASLQNFLKSNTVHELDKVPDNEPSEPEGGFFSKAWEYVGRAKDYVSEALGAVSEAKDNLREAQQKQGLALAERMNLLRELQGKKRIGRGKEETTMEEALEESSHPLANIAKKFGGIIDKGMKTGGYIPVRVTAGEGYIPPEKVGRNLNLLNRLNKGRSVPFVPAEIEKFHGPSGIDKIPTVLPKGSYVLSQKGMEAYQRSVSEGARPYQEGGEVVSEAEDAYTFEAPMQQEKDLGKFTIVVEKEGRVKEFPIRGKVSVLSDLKKELEQERMTKLH